MIDIFEKVTCIYHKIKRIVIVSIVLLLVEILKITGSYDHDDLVFSLQHDFILKGKLKNVGMAEEWITNLEEKKLHKLI